MRLPSELDEQKEIPRNYTEYCVYAVSLLAASAALYCFHMKPVSQYYLRKANAEVIMKGDIVASKYIDTALQIYETTYIATIIMIASCIFALRRMREEVFLLGAVLLYLVFCQAVVLVNSSLLWDHSGVVTVGV